MVSIVVSFLEEEKSAEIVLKASMMASCVYGEHERD